MRNGVCAQCSSELSCTQAFFYGDMILLSMVIVQIQVCHYQWDQPGGFCHNNFQSHRHMEIDFLCQNLVQEVTCLGGNVWTARLIESFFITKDFHIIKKSVVEKGQGNRLWEAQCTFPQSYSIRERAPEDRLHPYQWSGRGRHPN